MLTLHNADSFAQWRSTVGDEPVAVVMTMGALHDGHVALINAARGYLRQQHDGRGYVVVTIFVNPTQFDETTDFNNYPRTLDDDVQKCESSGADIVFAPLVHDVYPEGIEHVQRLTPSQHADVLDGPLRPGHFSGVITVVSRLFDLVKPTAAFFGEKDYQQLVVIKDLAAMQSREIEVVGVETVRESDGLAHSSRNKNLSLTGRALAKHIPAVLALVRHLLAEGHQLEDCVGEGIRYLATQRGIELEYLEVRALDLDPVITAGPARLFVAVTIGDVRLIDNIEVEIGEENVARH